jgi:uncharacterized protein (DUF1778 family)
MVKTERNKSIQARVSKEEYAQIEKMADCFGLSISNYVRLVVLTGDIKINEKSSTSEN